MGRISLGRTGKKLKYIYFLDMTHRYIPTNSTYRQNQLKWLNILHHVHGSFCDCPNGMAHTTALIFENNPDLQFSPPEKDIIKSCLSGENTGDKDGENHGVDGFTGEELELLFKEPDGEDAAADR